MTSVAAIKDMTTGPEFSRLTAPTRLARLRAMPNAKLLPRRLSAGSLPCLIAVIGLVYLLKLVLMTALFSILLAFVLEPLVARLSRIGIPRAAGALFAVVLMVGLAGGLTYFFYSRAVDFATQLPEYSGKTRSELADV